MPFAKNRCVFGDASFAGADAFIKRLLFDMPHHHSVLFKLFFFATNRRLPLHFDESTWVIYKVMCRLFKKYSSPIWVCSPNPEKLRQLRTEDAGDNIGTGTENNCLLKAETECLPPCEGTSEGIRNRSQTSPANLACPREATLAS